MFRKSFLIRGAAAMALALGFVACSDDEGKDDVIVIKSEGGGIELTIRNPQKWVAAARVVAADLKEDVDEAAAKWENGMAEAFKAQQSSKSIDDIIDECGDMAEEIAEEKISSPLAVFTSGDDCLANLGSIRNCLLGSLDGSVAQASIMALAAAENPSVAGEVSKALEAASAAVKAIPRPLKANTGSAEAKAAKAVCLRLESVLEGRLAPLFANMSGREAEQKAVVSNYVDAVVLPSVSQAREAAAGLMSAMDAAAVSPTEATVKAAVEAYVKARAALDLCEAFASLS